jgi:hypothetical protein
MFISRSIGIATLLVGIVWPGHASLAAERDACGCYQTDSGSCVCDKKARCGCPGLCEPQGCEAQRQKAFQRELDAETKKAREADRQHASDKGEPTAKAAPAITLQPTRTMTPVQQKQLAKLLDLYFAAHPGARSQSAGALRDEVTPTSGRVLRDH